MQFIKIFLFLILLICSIGLSSATSTYDIATNNITLGTGENTIASVYSDVSNNSVLSYNSTENSYELNARILSNTTSNFNISDTTLNVNGSTDDEYYIETGYNFILNNATIQTKISGIRFYIWVADEAGSWNAFINDAVIDGGFLKFKTDGYYDSPSSPYCRIFDSTIKNVNVTGTFVDGGSVTVLQFFENAGKELHIDNLTLENVHGGYVYSGTIILNSGANNARLYNITVSNTTHQYHGNIHIFGAAQNITISDITLQNGYKGISYKEGLNSDVWHNYTNITILNMSNSAINPYQNNFNGETSGARIENLYISDVEKFYSESYTNIARFYIFDGCFQNATYGFQLRSDIMRCTNVHVNNVDTMYRKLNGDENGEVNWYEILDINVTTTSGTPIENAVITITPNITAPVHNVVDKWFNNRSNSLITTNVNGHISLPSNETEMVAILRQRDYDNGYNTSYYNYSISVSANGYDTNTSVIVTPLDSWYRNDVNIPIETVNIQLSGWAYNSNHTYINICYRYSTDGTRSIIGRNPLDTDICMGSIKVVVS